MVAAALHRVLCIAAVLTLCSYSPTASAVRIRYMPSLMEIRSRSRGAPAFSSENAKNLPHASKEFAIAPKIEGGSKKKEGEGGDSDDGPEKDVKVTGATGKEFSMGEAFYDDDPEAAVKKDIDFEKIEKDRKYKELIKKKAKSHKKKKKEKEKDAEPESEGEDQPSPAKKDDDSDSSSSGDDDSADEEESQNKMAIRTKIRKINKIMKKKNSKAAATAAAGGGDVKAQMKLLLQMLGKGESTPTPHPTAPPPSSPMQLLQKMLASQGKAADSKMSKLESTLESMLTDSSKSSSNATAITNNPQFLQKGGLGALTWPTVQSYVEAKEKQTNARLDSIARHFEEVINQTHTATDTASHQMRERMAIVSSVMAELKTVAAALEQLKWDLNSQQQSQFRPNENRGRRGPPVENDDEDDYMARGGGGGEEDGDDDNQGGGGGGGGGGGEYGDDDYYNEEDDYDRPPSFRQLRRPRKREWGREDLEQPMYRRRDMAVSKIGSILQSLDGFQGR